MHQFGGLVCSAQTTDALVVVRYQDVACKELE